MCQRMKFVIVGYGRVGMRTARILAEEDHEVTVIDTDADKIERAREEGFAGIAGDGSREEEIGRASCRERVFPVV